VKSSLRVVYIVLISLAAAAIAMAIAAIVLSILGASVTQTFKIILTEPLKDIVGITEILVRAIPLTLVSLGIAISFRAGILNIGAEGQIQMGGIAGAML